MQKFILTGKIEFPEEMETVIQKKLSLFMKYWYSEVTGNIKNELKADSMRSTVLSEYKSAFVDTLINIKIYKANSKISFNIPSAIKNSFTSVIFARWGKLFKVANSYNKRSAEAFSDILSFYFNDDMLLNFYNLNKDKIKNSNDRYYRIKTAFEKIKLPVQRQFRRISSR